MPGPLPLCAADVGPLLVNALLFQAGWFAAVLGAAAGLAWAGPAASLAIVLVAVARAADRREEIKLLTRVALLGFAFDTALRAAGLFTPAAPGVPEPLSPPWMVGLWLNLATTLRVSLAWLAGRPLLAALFGAVGGPLAYYGGARLGAAALPTPAALAVLAAAWGLLMPLLFALAKSPRH